MTTSMADYKKAKVDLLFNSELDILYVGSQGSIHGQLLYDLYTFDVIFVETSPSIASYADLTLPVNVSSTIIN